MLVGDKKTTLIITFHGRAWSTFTMQGFLGLYLITLPGQEVVGVSYDLHHTHYMNISIFGIVNKT